MKKLSVVASVYNCEKTIERMLNSVKWADEIIIVDNNSTDGTYKILGKYATKIFKKSNNLMLNTNKNFGFDKATGDYILNLDSDEEIPPDLSSEIIELLKNDPISDGYWIPRKNIIFGKWIQYGIWWPDKQLRLFKNGSGKFPCKHIHEYLQISGTTSTLEIPFIHHNYETIDQYLYKLGNIYTDNEAANLINSGYIPCWQDAIRFPLSDFLKLYFAQKGYKDGLHGLVLAILQSFYSFIVFVKLWEKKSFFQNDIPLPEISREFVNGGKEVLYWQATALSEEAKSPITKFYYKVKRRLKV